MSVNIRVEGDVAVLDVAGRITIGQGDVEVKEAVQRVLASGREKVLLVMTGVTALDSSGVGELVAAYASAKNRKADLKLAKLSPKVSSVLQVTQLIGVIDNFPTEEEALVAFAKG